MYTIKTNEMINADGWSDRPLKSQIVEGWQVVRFTAKEVKEDVVRCIGILLDVIRARSIAGIAPDS